MLACWVVSPIVIVDGVNKPKVATFVGGNPPVQLYAHSSAIYPERGKTWSLSFVTSRTDFAAIDADPECERVFADEVIATQEGQPTSVRRDAHTQWLGERPDRSRSELLSLASARGIDASDISVTATRRDWVRQLGMAASGDSDFRPEGWHV